MDVEYDKVTWKGEVGKERDSIQRFMYDSILYDSDEKRVFLENQPKVVCEALGRLVEILIKRGVLDLQDLKDISGCDWGSKAASLKLVKEGE